MKIDTKLEGQEELERKLAKMTESVGYDRMEKIMYESAEEVRDELKTAAPAGPTGNLARSPVAKKMPKSRSPVVIAGIDRKIAPHAHLIEFGTVKMAARPFFRPVWDRLRGKVNKEIADKARKSVESSVQ